ncbi:MAG TPA: hypothetical protein VGC76_07145 [Pyrinomonadaceae bacterium]|jgi:hypothetical protein
MKRIILFAAFINLFFLSACSSEPSAPLDTTNANAPNSNAEIAEVNTNLVPMKALRNVNANANQLNPIVPTNANTNVKAQLNSAPAPFDSSVTTTMNKQNQFLETRTFRNDPQIQKLERLQETKKIKVYMKNGKVAELPYDKGSVLFTNGSPQDILTAAGVKPLTAPQSINPAKVEQMTKDAIKKIQ